MDIAEVRMRTSIAVKTGKLINAPNLNFDYKTDRMHSVSGPQLVASVCQLSDSAEFEKGGSPAGKIHTNNYINEDSWHTMHGCRALHEAVLCELNIIK